MAEYEDITIEPRGDDYVLIRDDNDGTRSETILSETAVIALGRLAPTVVRRILAAKSKAASGIESTPAAPVKSYRIDPDIHNELVLLRLLDDLEARFDFSLTPAGARELGNKLIEVADKMDRTTKPTAQ